MTSEITFWPNTGSPELQRGVTKHTEQESAGGKDEEAMLQVNQIRRYQ